MRILFLRVSFSLPLLRMREEEKKKKKEKKKKGGGGEKKSRQFGSFHCVSLPHALEEKEGKEAASWLSDLLTGRLRVMSEA